MTPTKPISLKNVNERIYGFDLIRTASFLAIALHHFGTELWNLPVFTPFAEVNFVWTALEVFSRTISFSGHTILFLSTFLIGHTSKKNEKALKLIPVLIFFWLLSSIIDYVPGGIFWAWDIFPLIATGLGAIAIVHKVSRWPNLFLILTGFILLCIPFWEFRPMIELPLFLRQILIGDCLNNLSNWPVLPWIGLVFLGYGIGKAIQNISLKLNEDLSKMELLFWPMLLVGCSMYWGPYYRIISGNQFSCNGMRQAPIVFFAHIIPMIFLIRISMINSINNYFSQNAFVQKISNLQINKKFGMAYFCHFLVIDILIYFAGINIAASPKISATVAIGILIITEISLRIISSLIVYSKSVILFK